MKPYTLEWWLFWLEYTQEMFNDFDDVTDKISLDQIEVEDEDYYWSEWERYIHISSWIKNRIINKYGEND